MDLEWLIALRLRCRALLNRRQLDRDLKAELEFHLSARADKHRQSGLDESEAARRAHSQFGNTTLIKETSRDMWTFQSIEILFQDLRYAVRTLRKNPGFALAAILTLALGIGANTAIFSVVNAVILRPLPYPEPSRLVELWGNVKRAKVERRGTSLPDYADWRDQSRSFESMALFTDASFTLTGVDEPERLSGEFAAYTYFSMLGVQATVGRTYRPEEDQAPQRDAVIVLSDSLWRRRFGGDPSVVGRALRLNDRDYTIIGVMPAWFRGITDRADFWAPLHMAGTARDFADRGSRGPAVLARLKPGVSIAQAQAEMDRICKDLEAAHRDTNEARGVELSPLTWELFGDIRKPLLVLLAAVAFVLSIACTNVANLLLARSEGRQREIAVRIALGAGRARVLRQLTTESCLLSFIGAAAGILFARWGVRALMSASPVTFPSYIHPSLDPLVMLFTIVISCGTGLLLGLAPAAQVRFGNLADAFKQASSHSAGNRGARLFRDALVVAEVAVAMLLLTGAGLLIRSVNELAAIRPGYDPSHVLTLRVTLPRLAPPSAPPGSPIAPRAAAPATQPDIAAVVSARELLRRISAVPGIESASAGSDLPLGDSGAIFYTAEGQPPVTAQNRPRGYVHRVTPEFFKTLRIPLVAGRPFTETEMQGSSNVVIVSENVAKRFWPGQDPIGKRVKSGPTPQAPWLNIVGVVNEMKYRALPENPTADPDLFFPFAERQRGFSVLVRTPLDPGSLSSAVRKAIREAEPAAVIYGVSTMDEFMARATSRARFTGWLMGIFAAAALVLAMIGIYGVMSYAVSTRTQEIGVRMALGAARGDVLRLVLGGGMRMVAIGLGLGIAAALAMTRLITSLLYGVKPADPVTFSAAAAALAILALAACFLPASRASSIAPASALRDE